MNAKMVPRSMFEQLSLPTTSGDFFLRPDHILAAFRINGAAPPILTEAGAAALKKEVSTCRRPTAGRPLAPSSSHFLY